MARKASTADKGQQEKVSSTQETTDFVSIGYGDKADKEKRNSKEMTDAYKWLHKPEIQGQLPHLSSGKVWIVGPETKDYNCFAQALGTYNKRFDPAATSDIAKDLFRGIAGQKPEVGGLEDLKHRFGKEGYTFSESRDLRLDPKSEKVAVFEGPHDSRSLLSPGKATTHVATQLPDGNWVSKLNDGPCIVTENTDQVRGPDAERVVGVFTRPRTPRQYWSEGPVIGGEAKEGAKTPEAAKAAPEKGRDFRLGDFSHKSTERLDPAAVTQANEQLWKENPELHRRQLTLGPEDTAYRKEWVQHYREAEKEIAKSHGQTHSQAPSRLDPAAVTQANQQLWKENPELHGRQLTPGPQDAAYRKEWTQHYREAEKEVAKSHVQTHSQDSSAPQHGPTRTGATAAPDQQSASPSSYHSDPTRAEERQAWKDKLGERAGQGQKESKAHEPAAKGDDESPRVRPTR